jgi:hypothetical protein
MRPGAWDGELRIKYNAVLIDDKEKKKKEKDREGVSIKKPALTRCCCFQNYGNPAHDASCCFAR